MISISDTISHIITRLQTGLDDRQRQLEADITFRQDIKWALSDHSQQARHQADILVENLMAAYDRVSRKYENELSDAISFFPVLRRSIGAIFSKSQSLKSWLESFTHRLSLIHISEPTRPY